MEISEVSQKIHSQINKAEHILLIAHQNPDADCLGSLVVFSSWLESLNKNHTRFCLHQPPPNLTWLVNFEPLVNDPEYLIKQPYDLVIVLDSGDLKYAGVDNILPKLSPQPKVINIDHHATNQNFGDINLVNTQSVSTTEIVYQLFKTLKIRIDAKVASAMLAGIIYDTYNFTNPNTNHQSLETASQLLLSGAQLGTVSDSILKTKSIDTLKIWGEILTRLSHCHKFNVVSTVVTRQDLADNLADSEVTEGVANFLNNLTGVKAALILQEQADGSIKGSFRTNNDLIDVSKLARILGGGGHKKAAGFKIKGQLKKTRSGSWQIV
ncbi:MAG: hypothetical protein CMI53_01445 [Parcubacteria group bacterium]|nr:hypothetical protein [Parcubacteria group bacterium]|tara:strand:+ start:2393 stop:3364 length:972 start_codon:yes stop_codon:yes gene_type:complete